MAIASQLTHESATSINNYENYELSKLLKS